MNYLDMFLNGDLAISLKDATIDDFFELDFVIPYHWASGNSFASLYNYASHDFYAYVDNGRIYYYDTSYPKDRESLKAYKIVTVSEFLNDDKKVFDVSESEIFDLLEDK